MFYTYFGVRYYRLSRAQEHLLKVTTPEDDFDRYQDGYYLVYRGRRPNLRKYLKKYKHLDCYYL